MSPKQVVFNNPLYRLFRDTPNDEQIGAMFSELKIKLTNSTHAPACTHLCSWFFLVGAQLPLLNEPQHRQQVGIRFGVNHEDGSLCIEITMQQLV